MLPYYHGHMAAHPNSLIARLTGLHRVQTRWKTINFIAMRNVLLGHTMSSVYDMKGSVHDRNASVAERAKPLPILKDMDFDRVLFMCPQHRQLFKQQIEADAKVQLQRHVRCVCLLPKLAVFPRYGRYGLQLTRRHCP
jgi:hypothetical protein